jgi:hypothetical protein
MPGNLAPEDLWPLARRLGTVPTGLVYHGHVVASEGAVVWSRERGFFRIRTLVPAARENGTCGFLAGDRCSVHDVSPFACACCDPHMDGTAGEARSRAMLLAILEDQERDGPYARLWRLAHQLGRVATPLNERKQRLRAVLAQGGFT